MAEFIELGALWRSDSEKKTFASGFLDLNVLRDVLERARTNRDTRDAEKVRIFLMDSRGGSSRAPDWRISVVFSNDGESRDRGRDRDSDRGRKQDRDRPRDRDREENGARGQRDSDRGRDRDRERSAPGNDDDIPF